jgi:hypothetical protein
MPGPTASGSRQVRSSRASQQNQRADVRSGSGTDIVRSSTNVRFTPQSGCPSVAPRSSLCAHRIPVDAEERNRALCVFAIANGMTAEQGFPGRNLPSTQLPARSWLIQNSRGAHCRFRLLAHAESILLPLLDNHRELTLCSPFRPSTRRPLMPLNCRPC